MITIELNRKYVHNVYGGSKVYCEYSVVHQVGYTTNSYFVTVEVRGLERSDVYLDWATASVQTLTNNEETLSDEAILAKIEAHLDGGEEDE